MVSLLPRPREVEQHHDTLVHQHPVRQETPAGAEGRRPSVLGPPDMEHRAGGRGIGAQDRSDAGNVAAEDGWGVAELLADPVGQDDLVQGYSPSSSATSSQGTTSERSPWRM